MRPRHYVPFASWFDAQFATAAHYTRSEIKYKVDGRWDSSAAVERIPARVKIGEPICSSP